MKKSSLATILVLSTIGVTLFAQADSGNRGGFQELPNIEHKADKKHGERKKGEHRERGGELQYHEFHRKHPQMYHDKGGFMPSKEPTKVVDAETWLDDQVVLLEGKIVKQVGKKDFIFKDDSGELTIEVERKAWHGETVTPNDKVKVIAEVEKSWGKTELEALFVGKIKSDQAPAEPESNTTH